MNVVVDVVDVTASDCSIEMMLKRYLGTNLVGKLTLVGSSDQKLPHHRLSSLSRLSDFNFHILRR